MVNYDFQYFLINEENINGFNYDFQYFFFQI